MKTQLITWYHNANGGTNNLCIAQVRDMRHNLIKSFSSLKGMEYARNRAIAFQNKLVNKFDHHLDEFVNNKRLSLLDWQMEANRINNLLTR